MFRPVNGRMTLGGLKSPSFVLSHPASTSHGSLEHHVILGAFADVALRTELLIVALLM